MANALLTRAQFRDSVRRKLGIVPPIDVSNIYPPGAQPTNSPYPTNQQITDAFQDAISDINRKCEFHVTGIPVGVNAVDSSTIGPFGLYLGDLTPNSTGTTNAFAPNARVVDVQRALWTPTGSTIPVLLEPMYRDNMDRSGESQYYRIPPSQPRQWYVEGYVLYITPAQSEAGTLTLTCTTGIAGMTCDTDTLDQVPFDYQNVFEYQAIVNLSITQTMDVEAQARAALYGPKAADGMASFKAWVFGGSGAPQPRLPFRSYRGGYGRFRVVR